MTPALEVSGLRKSYGGVPAVDGVSFRVEEGTIVGLLGPNGAGKTTTVRMIVGILGPDEGRIELQLRAAPARIRDALQAFGYYHPDIAIFEALAAAQSAGLRPAAATPWPRAA